MVYHIDCVANGPEVCLCSLHFPLINLSDTIAAEARCVHLHSMTLICVIQQHTSAIKIFGLFTHAQMDKRLWATISSHLATRTAHEQHQSVSFPCVFPSNDAIESSDALHVIRTRQVYTYRLCFPTFSRTVCHWTPQPFLWLLSFNPK
jgi:hypothetical protein